METLTLILLLLGLSFILSEFLSSKKIPRFLGPLTIGVLCGLPYFKSLITPSSELILGVFSQLGLLLLMFYVGLQIDVNVLRKKNFEPIIHGLFSFLIPFILGFILALILGLPVYLAIIVAVALSITSEASVIKILEDFNLRRKKIGRNILSAGLIDDIIGILILSAVISLFSFQSTTVGLGMFLLTMLILLIGLFFARIYIIPFLLSFVKNKSESEILILMILLALLMSLATELLGLSSMIGAVIAGLLVRHVLNHGTLKDHYEELHIEKLVRIVSFDFLAVFFFIWVGYNTDFSLVLLNPGIAIVMTFIAIFGKLAGSFITGFFYKTSERQSMLIGWALTPRGALELAILEVTRQFNIIPIEIYSAIVFMAIMTLFISPLVMVHLVKQHHKHYSKTT